MMVSCNVALMLIEFEGILFLSSFFCATSPGGLAVISNFLL